MELVDGETLRARLAQGAIPPRRAIAYALQIAKGIAAAHARGIVHRDLKPENVMITRDDHVKILDFGLAKPIESGRRTTTRAVGATTSAGMVLGTFGYMAPEQVRGQAVDHRADMFAFGAVLYEMLTGERAFDGDTAADTMTAILTKDPPDLDTARMSISPGLDRIVRRCLEKTPELRFQSANDLAFALETLSTGSTLVVSAVTRRRIRTVPAPARRVVGVAAVGDRRARRHWPQRRRGGRAARRRAEPRWDHVHAHHRAGRRRDVAEPVAGRDDGRVRRSRERQLGHLHPARRRPQRDADPQRSAARRRRAGVLARWRHDRVSRVRRRRRHLRRRRHR